MRTVVRAGILGMLLALAAPAALADNQSEASTADGRVKAATCMGCHGVPTYTRAYPNYNIPKIGGQHAKYIIKALKDYRAGKRSYPTMHAQASTLSNADMADVAAFLSQDKKPDQEFTINKTYKAGMKLAKSCAACHGKGGHSTTPTFPILAGQYKSYLIYALKAYRSGKRESAIMNGMAATLSNQEIRKIASFYASQETGLYTPSISKD